MQESIQTGDFYDKKQEHSGAEAVEPLVLGVCSGPFLLTRDACERGW